VTKSNRAQALLRKNETPAPTPATERRRASLPPEAEGAPVDVTHLRRKSDPVRRESEAYLGYFLISEGWSMTAIAMGIAVLMLSLNQFRMPNPEILGLLVTAVVMVAAARLFVSFERTSRRPLGWRIGAMTVSVVVPMMLFGAGLACGTNRAL
jgi:hypothetical protein